MFGVVVVLQHDRQKAAAVASALRKHFGSVVTARSVDEVRLAATGCRIAASVLDLEMVSLDEIERLKSKFDFPVVCTHRLANDRMWVLAVRAGAEDCCYDDDVAAICRAIPGQAGRGGRINKPQPAPAFCTGSTAVQSFCVGEK